MNNKFNKIDNKVTNVGKGLFVFTKNKLGRHYFREICLNLKFKKSVNNFEKYNNYFQEIEF